LCSTRRGRGGGSTGAGETECGVVLPSAPESDAC
jgi:hypothetical protein